MIVVKHKADLQGTSRAIDTPAYATTRFLLREDGIGFTLTDVTIKEKTDVVIQYKHHVEAVYCLEGEATVFEFATGRSFPVRPGTCYAMAKHERHRFTCEGPVRLISIFVPALVGSETWDADGSFPLL